MEKFNRQTMIASGLSGVLFSTAWWLIIHTQLVKDTEYFPLGFKFFVGPILATLFIFPLFPFSMNLIISNEEYFGDGDMSFKRKLLFLLMALQFLPILISVGLFASAEVLEGKNSALLIEQLIANLLFLVSSMILKFGNYIKEESDSF